MQVYTGRGFLTKLLTARADLEKLAEVDDGLTKCVSYMQVALQVHSMDVQKASYERMFQANDAILAKIEALGGPKVCVRVCGSRLFPTKLAPTCR